MVMEVTYKMEMDKVIYKVVVMVCKMVMDQKEDHRWVDLVKDHIKEV